MKENELKKGKLDAQQECSFRDIIEKEEIIKDQNDTPITTTTKQNFSIEVICRTAYDFFARD
jgi:hypothetical protein